PIYGGELKILCSVFCIISANGPFGWASRSNASNKASGAASAKIDSSSRNDAQRSKLASAKVDRTTQSTNAGLMEGSRFNRVGPIEPAIANECTTFRRSVPENSGRLPRN